MPRKPIRGRFYIACPLPGGGSWRCESVKERSLSAQEIARSLREYAEFIETCFIKPSAERETQEPPT